MCTHIIIVKGEWLWLCFHQLGSAPVELFYREIHLLGSYCTGGRSYTELFEVFTQSFSIKAIQDFSKGVSKVRSTSFLEWSEGIILPPPILSLPPSPEKMHYMTLNLVYAKNFWRVRDEG